MFLGETSRLPLAEAAIKARGLVGAQEFETSTAIAAATGGTGAVFVPLIPHVCGVSACMLLADNGEPLIFDRAHFTLAGALSTVRRMKASGALTLN